MKRQDCSYTATGKVTMDELKEDHSTTSGNDQSRSLSSKQEDKERIQCEGKSKASLPLPWKVHEMLDSAEKEGFASIISWLPDIDAFRVHQPQGFVEMIMPRYFHQTQFKSFQRQCK